MNTLPNVLIVDDLEVNLKILEEICNNVRVNLIKALSGNEALVKTKGIELALAIVDIKMPEMNGYELALKLNEKKSDVKVPIIFITANYFDEMDVFKGYRSGAVDYIFKPINIDILQSKINVFLDLFDQKQTILRKAKLRKELADELIVSNVNLRKSEEKYRNYIDNAPDGIFVVDETGRYVEVNKAASRITGYSKEELLKMSISDISLDGSIEEARAHLGKLIKLDPSKAELIFKHKNGTTRWWIVEAVKLSETRFLGFAKDINERKLSEEALRVSEEKFRKAISDAPFPIIIHLEGGKVETVNDQWQKVTGYSLEDIPTISIWTEKACGFNKDVIKSRIEKLHEIDKKEDKGEFIITTKSGEKRNLFFSSTSLGETSDGKNILIGMALDLTEMKIAEMELRSSEEKLKTIFDISPGLICVANVNTGYFTQCNKAVTKLLNFSVEKFISKPYMEFIHPDDRQSSLDEINEELKGSDVADFENRYLCKDGTYKWLAWHGTAADKDGNVHATATDITRRKLTELANKKNKKELRRLTYELIQTREIEKKNLARELHDEVGQSLTAIKINLAEVQKKLPNNLPLILMDRLKETDEITESIIEQISNFINILRPTMLDDLGLISALRWYTNQLKKRTGLKIILTSVTIPEFSNPETSIMLYRIIQEALNNVVKHASATTVNITFELDKLILKLSISDDGIGFDVIKTLQLPDIQRGLGLIGMHERVEMIGGSINIISKPVKGTKLVIQLPIIDNDE